MQHDISMLILTVLTGIQRGLVMTALSGRGGLVFGPQGIHEDEEEEEGSPVVNSDITLSSREVNSCSSQLHRPAYVY